MKLTVFLTILPPCPQNTDGLISVVYPRGNHESIAPSGYTRGSKRLLFQRLHHLSRNTKLNIPRYGLYTFYSLLPKRYQSDRKLWQVTQIRFSSTPVKSKLNMANIDFYLKINNFKIL